MMTAFETLEAAINVFHDGLCAMETPRDKDFINSWCHNMSNLVAVFYRHQMLSEDESDHICELILAMQREFS